MATWHLTHFVIGARVFHFVYVFCLILACGLSETVIAILHISDFLPYKLQLTRNVDGRIFLC